MSSSEIPSSPTLPRWRSWLQLLRIPALPSAWANILLAFLWVHDGWLPVGELLALLVASSGFYLAGMVLNDVFDHEIDAIQRPQRPLPSGAISRRQAWVVGIGLLGLGCLGSLVAGALATNGRWHAELAEPMLPLWRTTGIGLLLGGCVVAYDGWLKQTPLAPWLMGLCRGGNLLLGGSTAPAASGAADPWLGLPISLWWIAGGLTLLIAGLTWLARREAAPQQNRVHLIGAAAVMIAGMVMLGASALVLDSEQVSSELKIRFPSLIAIVCFPILRRVLEALVTAQANSVQMAVVTTLRSLIVLDACLAYLAMPDQWGFSVGILALLIPALTLGRWMKST